MQSADRPAKIYFDRLNEDFGMDINEVCSELLTDTPAFWFSKTPISPREIARDTQSRYKLHKRIKDKLPGEQPLEIFLPFNESVPNLLRAIERRAWDNESLTREETDRLVFNTVVASSPMMKWSLQVHTRGSDFYDNLLDSIRTPGVIKDIRDRSIAALILFTAAGTLGDPLIFGPIAEEAIIHYCGVDVLATPHPTTTPLDPVPDEPFDEPVLGLQRILHGNVRGRRHTLDPNGTIIGSMPSTSGDYVADVDRSVAKNHLRIFQDEGGWFAQDLGTENGFLIIRSEERLYKEVSDTETLYLRTESVHAASLASDADSESPETCLELHIGDILVIGSTLFEVQLFQLGE